MNYPLGAFRFNNDTRKLEYYDGNQWVNISTHRPSIGKDGLGRGLIANVGSEFSNGVHFINIPTTGDSQDFGDFNYSKRRDPRLSGNRLEVHNDRKIPRPDWLMIEKALLSSPRKSKDTSEARHREYLHNEDCKAVLVRCCQLGLRSSGRPGSSSLYCRSRQRRSLIDNEEEF